MSDRLNELEQLLLNDEAAQERAALANDEFGELLEEYRQLQAEEQERVTEEIRRQHVAALQEELEEAQADLTEADEVEAERLDDSTRWLSAEQLTEAQARATFVRENMADLNPDDLVAQMRRVAAGGDAALQWLYLRYVADRWEEFDPAQQGIGLHGEYQQALESLEEAVIPEEVRTATTRAHEQRLEAEQRRVELKKKIWEANGGQGQFNPFR